MLKLTKKGYHFIHIENRAVVANQYFNYKLCMLHTLQFTESHQAKRMRIKDRH